MMLAVLAVAHCVVASSPVLATASEGELRASLTPSAVHLGEHTATGCDGLPAPHPTAIAFWQHQLAVGFRDGGVWTWDGVSFTPLADAPGAAIRALAATGETLWIGTADGLWSAQPGARPARFAHRTLGSSPIAALAADGAALRVAVDPRGAWRIDRGTATRVDRFALIGCFAGRSARQPGDCGRGSPDVPIHVTALAELHHRLVVGTFDDGVWLETDRGFRRVPSPRMIDALLVDGDTVYAAAATGLYRMTTAASSLADPAAAIDAFSRVELGLPSAHINDLAKAGDTLWLATSRGVAGWDGRSVRTLSTGDARVVYAITVASDGAIWAGTIGGALRFGPDATVAFDRARGTLPGDWVTALLPDDHGGVLAGTYDAGVVRLAPDGTSKPLAPLDGPLWINPHGLARVDGAIAAATLGQGLRWSRGSSPALPDDDVTATLRIGHTLWIGTRGGLARSQAPP
jgi:ligand-binding sensor domain-containing protein